MLYEFSGLHHILLAPLVCMLAMLYFVVNATIYQLTSSDRMSALAIYDSLSLQDNPAKAEPVLDGNITFDSLQQILAAVQGPQNAPSSPEPFAVHRPNSGYNQAGSIPSTARHSWPLSGSFQQSSQGICTQQNSQPQLPGPPEQAPVWQGQQQFVSQAQQRPYVESESALSVMPGTSAAWHGQLKHQDPYAPQPQADGKEGLAGYAKGQWWSGSQGSIPGHQAPPSSGSNGLHRGDATSWQGFEGWQPGREFEDGQPVDDSFVADAGHNGVQNPVQHPVHSHASWHEGYVIPPGRKIVHPWRV